MQTTTEMLDEMTKRHWDRSYGDLTRSSNLWGGEPLPFLPTALETFRQDQAVTVLDLPCGDGRNTVPLAGALPFIVAADASPHALGITRNLLAAQGVGNVLVQQADVFATPFGEEQFDGIFCADVLGHLKESRQALVEMLRVCRRGRCVVGNFFALGDSTRGVDMVPLGPEEEYLYADKFYFKFYSRDDVLRLLSDLPATVVSVELATWVEPPHEGYRPYQHEHQSWVFVARKRGE